MKKAFAILIAVMVLASCSTTKRIGGFLAPVYVTNTKKIQVLPPQHMVGEQDAQILLELKFGKDTFSLVALVFADSQTMEISLFNDFGTDMGSLFFDGQEATLDCALVPPQLKAEYIINDLETAWYNPEALKANYAASKLTLDIEKTDDGEIRRVMSGKKLIEEITVSDSEVVVKNILRGYEYRLVQ